MSDRPSDDAFEGNDRRGGSQPDTRSDVSVGPGPYAGPERRSRSRTYDAAGANTVASLQAGHPFSLLLADDDRQRAAELEALLDNIADDTTRIVVATNPLRARLTLERLLIQVVSGPAPDPFDGNPVTVIRRIAQRLGNETRVILVIEKAETLHPDVLHFFGQTAAYFPDGIPRLQVLFVGRPEFRRVLDEPDALMDEQTAQLEAYRPSEPDPVFAPPPELAYQTLPPSRLPFVDTSLRAQLRVVWNESIWNRIGIIGGTLLGAAAITVAVMLAMGGNDGPILPDNSTALLELGPEPANIEADPPVLQPGPARDAETSQLRAEFETYLTALGRDLPNATQAQRRAWFQEFQIWRARTAAPR